MRFPPTHDTRQHADPADRVFEALIGLADRLDLPVEDVASAVVEMLERAVIVEELMDAHDVRRQAVPP